MSYKVLFIGSNPSQRSASIVPFWHDTNSKKVLSGWCSQVDEVCTTCFLNVSNQVTPNNRALKVSEIKANLETLQRDIELLKPDKIIALGKTAEKALTLLRLDHLAMPHPSGRNRKLNDKTYVEEKINGLKNYLKSI